MPLTTRVWGAGKVLFLCGALLLTYVVFAAAAMRMALKTREVSVPELAGKTVNEASAQLAEMTLALKVEEGRKVDPKVPAGQILAQDPPAGGSTRRQRSVRVWISAGPRSTTVPSLVGESERTAQLRVAQDGFGAGPSAEIRSLDYTVGTVVAQNPPAKSKSDTISLLVNRGERGATYVMPDSSASTAIGQRTCCARAASACRSSATTLTPACPGASCCGRARRPASRLLRENRSRSRSAGERAIAPSVLSADFSNLASDVRKAEQGGADLLHLDVMDGHFVPNITFGPLVVRAIRKVATVPLDVHLMIEDPDRYVEAFVDAGAARIAVHAEVLPHLHRTIHLIKKLGALAGVAINPSTPVARSKRSPATSTTCW